MSSVAPSPAALHSAEWDRLELVVRRLLDDYDRWRRRAVAAEARVRELDAALREVTEGKLDPLALAARIEALERENGALRERLGEARERIDRILSRLRFVEEGA